MALVAYLLPLKAHGQEIGGSIQGYFETRHTGIFGLDPELSKLVKQIAELSDGQSPQFHPDRRYGATNRIRPTLKLHIGDNATTVMTLEGHSFHGFDERDQNNIGDLVGLERAYFTLTQDWLDITAGKQLITWGHGLVVNPTDVFNERPADDLRAERSGVWAVRMLAALGDTANFTAAVAVEENLCCSPVAIGRFDITLNSLDSAITTAWDDRQNAMIFGIDAKGDLEIGLWAEATYTWSQETQSGHFDVETGIDYSFDVMQSLYVALEYIYQGDGAANTADYVDAFQTALSGGKRKTFLSRQMALALVQLGLTTEWKLQLLNALNVYDPSGFLNSQITWLPTGALEFTLGANVFYGSQEGELSSPLGSVSGGEYTLAVNNMRLIPVATAFLWGRYFF